MHTAMSFWLLAANIISASPINRRQLGGLSSTSDELQDGECRDVTFIFARGSTETGNMGSTVGPSTCSALKEAYGDDSVACQGVGGAYLGDLGSNALPDGTTQAALDEAAKMFNLAHTKCPQSKVVAGGYSQGAAVMGGSVGQLDSAVKDQVKGVVLYGYTKNLQNGGEIPDYPADRTKVFCNASDGVCSGTLTVTAGHLTYNADVQEAAQFLESKAGGSSSGSSSSTGSSSSGLGSLGTNGLSSGLGSGSSDSGSSSGGLGSSSSELGGLGGLGGSSSGVGGLGSSSGSSSGLGSLGESSGGSSSGLGSLFGGGK